MDLPSARTSLQSLFHREHQGFSDPIIRWNFFFDDKNQKGAFEILKQHPQLAAEEFCSACVKQAYPLWHFARGGANIEIIEGVYNMFPSAISKSAVTCDEGNEFPLHAACGVCHVEMKPKVVEFLATKYPDAMISFNKDDGYLPITMLLKNFPELSMSRDMQLAGVEAVQLLTKLCPQCLTMIPPNPFHKIPAITYAFDYRFPKYNLIPLIDSCDKFDYLELGHVISIFDEIRVEAFKKLFPKIKNKNINLKNVFWTEDGIIAFLKFIDESKPETDDIEFSMDNFFDWTNEVDFIQFLKCLQQNHSFEDMPALPMPSTEIYLGEDTCIALRDLIRAKLKEWKNLIFIFDNRQTGSNEQSHRLVFQAMHEALTPSNDNNNFNKISFHKVKSFSFAPIIRLLANTALPKNIAFHDSYFSEFQDALLEEVQLSPHIEQISFCDCEIHQDFDFGSFLTRFNVCHSLTSLHLHLTVEVYAHDTRPRRNDIIITEPLIRLLQNGQIKNLSFGGSVIFDEATLCEALRNNTTLLKLHVKKSFQIDEKLALLVSVLADHNNTLEEFRMLDFDHERPTDDSKARLLYRTNYYCNLNKNGRAQAHDMSTTLEAFLGHLAEVTTDVSAGKVPEWTAMSLQYDLLREHPSLWSGGDGTIQSYPFCKRKRKRSEESSSI